jgi:hypothetical protein
MCGDQVEEKLWADRISDGRLKPKQKILHFPEVKILIMINVM